MNSLGFGRVTLCSCAAAVMLAACGASQPPIGAPGAMAPVMQTQPALLSVPAGLGANAPPRNHDYEVEVASIFGEIRRAA